MTDIFPVLWRALLALSTLAFVALGAVPEARAEDSCITTCKVQCKKEETECLLRTTAACMGHPALALVCQGSYHRMCQAGGFYCSKVRCETITKCDPPEEPKPNRPGRTRGEPHLYTFDGYVYDFQAAGEFVLAQTVERDAVVQVRQQPWRDSRSLAVNTAAAMKVGNSRVGFYAGDTPLVRIDGETRTIGVGETVDLGGGGRVTRESADDYVVTWPGEAPMQADIMLRSWLNLALSPANSDAGRLEGLLGNFNNTMSDDLKPRGGAALDDASAIRASDLYGVFGDSWRISQEESLFDYQQGETTQTFTIPGFPFRYVSLADLDAEARARATELCEARGIASPVVLDDCIYDVGFTGDEAFAEGLGDEDGLARLAVTTPLYLDDWSQQGPPAAGQWRLAEDGLSVVQSVNGDPTYFVSPSDLIDVTIRGRMQVTTTADDDLIGFVMGYRAPLGTAEGGAPLESDFILFDWKGVRQVFEGALVEEGYRIARVKGVADQTVPHFWQMVEGGPVTILGAKSGAGQGWRSQTEYAFELRYGAERIQIFIDGALIFDVAGEFQPGRFGFYNYSQPQVRYSDFEVTPGVAFEGGR